VLSRLSSAATVDWIEHNRSHHIMIKDEGRSDSPVEAGQGRGPACVTCYAMVQNDRVLGGVLRAFFEILNPKHEIRNKSKTQTKNVQNEEAISHQ
jgi:hypothetical protein